MLPSTWRCSRVTMASRPACNRNASCGAGAAAFSDAVALLWRRCCGVASDCFVVTAFHVSHSSTHCSCSISLQSPFCTLLSNQSVWLQDVGHISIAEPGRYATHSPRILYQKDISKSRVSTLRGVLVYRRWSARTCRRCSSPCTRSSRPSWRPSTPRSS